MMKFIFVVLMLSLLLLPETVFSGETVTKVIESDVPMIIDGHWLHSPYTVVLTDSTITVNGYLYERPKEKEKPMPKPDRKKEFLDWLIRTAVDSAQAVIDSGGKFEEARQVMLDMFSKYADGDTLIVKSGKGKFSGAFDLKYYKIKYPIGVMVPLKPSYLPKPSYREGWLEPQFKELCRHLEQGFLVVTGRKYRYSFQPCDVPKAITEFKKLRELKYAKSELKRDRVYMKLGNSKIWLMKEVVEDIMNPKGN